MAINPIQKSSLSSQKNPPKPAIHALSIPTLAYLKKTEPVPSCPKLPSLTEHRDFPPLTATEKRAFDQIFSKWNLGSNICLIEYLALTIHTTGTKLVAKAVRHQDKMAFEQIMNTFSHDYIKLYQSLVYTVNTPTEIHNILYANNPKELESFFPRPETIAIATIQLINQVKLITASVKDQLSKAPNRAKEIRLLAEEICTLLQIYTKFISVKNPADFLAARSIAMTLEGEKMEANTNNELAHLTTYLEFLQAAYNTGSDLIKSNLIQELLSLIATLKNHAFTNTNIRKFQAVLFEYLESYYDLGIEKLSLVHNTVKQLKEKSCSSSEEVGLRENITKHQYYLTSSDTLFQFTINLIDIFNTKIAYTKDKNHFESFITFYWRIRILCPAIKIFLTAMHDRPTKDNVSDPFQNLMEETFSSIIGRVAAKIEPYFQDILSLYIEESEKHRNMMNTPTFFSMVLVLGKHRLLIEQIIEELGFVMTTVMEWVEEQKSKGYFDNPNKPVSSCSEMQAMLIQSLSPLAIMLIMLSDAKSLMEGSEPRELAQMIPEEVQDFLTFEAVAEILAKPLETVAEIPALPLETKPAAASAPKKEKKQALATAAPTAPIYTAPDQKDFMRLKKRREIIKTLEEAGFSLVRENKHPIYKNEEGRTVPVPLNAGEKPGTKKSIYEIAFGATVSHNHTA